MLLTVTTGSRSVQIKVKGSKPDTLRRAERAARRLLEASQEPERVPLPFGFTVNQLEPGDEEDE